MISDDDLRYGKKEITCVPTSRGVLYDGFNSFRYTASVRMIYCERRNRIC